ncbi:MAG: TrkH family potassium uptake protein [Eubacteriales bacterium]|nr:TrkH family potassium uptake protein [Eubacteriales bacterium]
MNIRLILHTLGKVLLIGGALMFPAVVVALLYQDAGLWPLLAGMGLTLSAGGLLQLCFPKNKNLRSRDGFAVVALCWVFFGVCGAMPLWLSGYFHCYIDCVFEIVSGFTTTGATVLTEIESLPKSILFWRSFTHWIGGMGILVLTMALIPKMGGRALHLLRAESTGPSPDKLLPRVSKSAKTLYALYIGISLVMVIALLLCGMNLYDALMHTFATAGTGGFSNYNASVGHFNSASIDVVVSVFMLLFSLNFTIFYRMLHKEWLAPVRDTETKVFVGIVALATLLIALNIRPLYPTFSNALRHGFFQVSSIVSTTGFATQDFNLWPQTSRIILVMLMIIGGCAGSTAGGIKVIRLIILCKNTGREVRNVVHPRGIHPIKLGKHALDEKTASSVATFFFCYVALMLLAMLVVSLDGFDFETTVTSVISCMTNTGPGLGLVGPVGNFAMLSPLSKIVLTLCMLIGRLDIYPILMFFSAAAWKKY